MCDSASFDDAFIRLDILKNNKIAAVRCFIELLFFCFNLLTSGRSLSIRSKSIAIPRGHRYCSVKRFIF